MNYPIFIDTNIPIYAAGRPHPLKESATRVIELVAEYPAAFVTSVEVIQELLHRYLAGRMWDAGRHVVEQFMILMEGHIEPVEVEDIQAAVRLADEEQTVSARDLLHAGVMRRVGATHIVSADRDFDRLAGVERLALDDVDSWQALLAS
jgi:predicted nucleic acid-binding protein